MNLLNRYLQAVGRLLPKARRDDIIAELRANILSQIEDREQELGRPLTEDEQADILRRHGNPTVIAGRYRESNLGLAFGRQLIGPELFPFYKTVLLINLTLTALVRAGLTLALMHTSAGGFTWTGAVLPPVMQVVVITLIFIVVDRHKSHVLDNWDPRKLPALKAIADDDGPTASNTFGFICLLVATVWVLLTPGWPYLMLGPVASYLPALALKPTSEWTEFYRAIGVMLCAQVVLQFFRLFRWLPRRKARMIDASLKVFGLLIGTVLLLKGPNYVTSPYPDVAKWANLNFEICIGVWMAIVLWQAGRIAFSLFRERHQMLPARQH